MTATATAVEADPILAFEENVKAARADILQRLREEWLTGAELTRQLNNREVQEPPFSAYQSAMGELVNCGQVESRRNANDEAEFRLPVKVKTLKPTRYDVESVEEMERKLRRVEAKVGRSLPRIYRRGQEEAWKADQRAAGIALVTDVIPEQFRAEFNNRGLQWLQDNGKGWRNQGAIDAKAVDLWREAVRTEAEKEQEKAA